MGCTLSKIVGHCPTNHNNIIMFTLVKHCAGQCPANTEMDCTSKSVEKCWTYFGLSGQSEMYYFGKMSDTPAIPKMVVLLWKKVGCCLANLDVICTFVKRCDYTLVKHCVGHCLVNPEMECTLLDSAGRAYPGMVSFGSRQL